MPSLYAIAEATGSETGAVQPTYTKHAQERIRDRNISEHEVDEVLAHPYRTVTSRANGNIIHFGRVDGRNLAVVVPNSIPPHVVTTWE